MKVTNASICAQLALAGADCGSVAPYRQPDPYARYYEEMDRAVAESGVVEPAG